MSQPDSPKTDLITGGLPPRDRDIDLVLVTGAGASCAFGVKGTRLPLMSDWCDYLVGKLSQRISYLETTRLKPGMSGEEFETRLGDFLQEVEAFRRIGGLLDSSVRFQDFGAATQMMSARGVMGQWHAQAVHHHTEITRLVHQSLYELFADAAVDLDAATEAYQGLFGALGITGPDARLVYATTNYDAIGEHAIRRSGRIPDWGQPPSLSQDGEARLVIPGLLNGLPRYVPVLHLHGRVGWFRRTDGRVYAADVVRNEAGFGVPVVMLPDPDRVYDQDDVIIAMWREFAEALTRARRVLVLGHSLNDQYLIRALAQNVQPLDRVAVTVLADESDPREPHESAKPLADKVYRSLGGAAVVPIRFGAGAERDSPGLQTWTDKLASSGLV
jgi:hypothetical protein